MQLQVCYFSAMIIWTTIILYKYCLQIDLSLSVNLSQAYLAAYSRRSLLYITIDHCYILPYFGHRVPLLRLYITFLAAGIIIDFLWCTASQLYTIKNRFLVDIALLAILGETGSIDREGLLPLFYFGLSSSLVSLAFLKV